MIYVCTFVRINTDIKISIQIYTIYLQRKIQQKFSELVRFTYFIWNNETFLETHIFQLIPTVLKYKKFIDINTIFSAILFIQIVCYNITIYLVILLTEYKNPNDSNRLCNLMSNLLCIVYVYISSISNLLSDKESKSTLHFHEFIAACQHEEACYSSFPFTFTILIQYTTIFVSNAGFFLCECVYVCLKF